MRITAAVGFAVLALALIGLWLRSLYCYEGVFFPLFAGYRAKVSTCAQVFAIEAYRSGSSATQDWGSWSEPVDIVEQVVDSRKSESVFGMGILLWDRPGWGIALMLPYWFAVGLSGMLAATFGFRKLRFSLRGLFITTTLLAVVLGAVVYSLRCATSDTPPVLFPLLAVGFMAL